MTQQEEIENLKQAILSSQWEAAEASANRLGEIGDEVIIFLISLLKSQDSGLRNLAALTLGDIKDNRAVDPLIEAILKKENHRYNGTLVFALESLNCSQKLKELFRILFYETYESKISAHSILYEQTFEFTKEDLHAIKQMWEDCKSHPEKCPGIENQKVFELIQDAVDGYIVYLKEG